MPVVDQAAEARAPRRQDQVTKEVIHEQVEPVAEEKTKETSEQSASVTHATSPSEPDHAGQTDKSEKVSEKNDKVVAEDEKMEVDNDPKDIVEKPAEKPESNKISKTLSLDDILGSSIDKKKEALKESPPPPKVAPKVAPKELPSAPEKETKPVESSSEVVPPVAPSIAAIGNNNSRISFTVW